MAIIHNDGIILRGKMGAVTCVYRKGTNFTRMNTPHRDPKSPAQLAQRSRYGQLQRLGSLWNRDFIAPYFQGDRAAHSPYNRFIKYNWTLWDKTTPPWQVALPFWDIPRLVPFSIQLEDQDSSAAAAVKILAQIPPDLFAAGAEFYGFYTRDSPEVFYKFTPQPVTASGPQTFDTGIDRALGLANVYCLCWLQTPGTTIPLCMPANLSAAPP
jgi:hypothetical protein